MFFFHSLQATCSQVLLLSLSRCLSLSLLFPSFSAFSSADIWIISCCDCDRSGIVFRLAEVWLQLSNEFFNSFHFWIANNCCAWQFQPNYSFERCTMLLFCATPNYSPRSLLHIIPSCRRTSARIMFSQR